MYLGALDFEIQQRAAAGTAYRQMDRTALESAHARDGGLEIGRIDRYVVDRNDDVAGLDTGTLRRGIRHATHDADAVLAGGYLDADAGVGARGADLHILEFIGAQEVE